MREVAVLATGLLIAFAGTAQTASENPSIQCLAALKEEPRAQLLANKMPFDVVTSLQPLNVLADQSKPDEREKAALLYFVAEGERCMDLANEWRKQHYPAEINAMLNTYRVDLVATLADLYAGKITFGDVAKFRAKQAADMKNAIDAIDHTRQAARADDERSRKDKEDARAQTQRESDERQRQAQQLQWDAQQEARRQAALMFLLNRPQPKANLVPLPQQPLRTNCSWIGNQWTCSTR